MWAEEAVFVLLEADGTRRVRTGVTLTYEAYSLPDKFQIIYNGKTNDNPPRFKVATSGSSPSR